MSIASPADQPPARRRRDRRPLAVVLTVLAVVGFGYAFQHMPANSVVADPAAANIEQLAASIGERQEVDIPVPVEEQVDPALPDSPDIRHKLKEASDLIRAKRYDDAIRHLNQSRAQLKDVPQTYLVLGRALEGRRDYSTARDFYNAALNKNPALADAHWGYATTSESLGDLPSALGAMRSYLHTESDADPFRKRIAQARSAIWEWESRLGRGAWGASKGIPAGFTAAELKRDGRGVAIKMPIGGGENPAGVTAYEIKSADKKEIYKR
ncbi:tetratricopeptide repeat protein [Dechloromonas sp. A34]|uniref:tetratricopeptide repeat protein n=1 Tax=Dechloromonas sp. A34 TaxID=447588 RepID=UPI0022496F77|nr:tetratricopeptide repeat protein [Dechloromonas sp. A34]